MLYRHCFLIFATEHVIRKVQEIQDGLKLNGTRQFLFYADDVNMLGGSIDTVKKKKTNALVVASIEIGSEITAEKTKYMIMSRDGDAGNITT